MRRVVYPRIVPTYTTLLDIGRAMPVFRCEQCREEFDHPRQRGRPPKYCTEHRQAQGPYIYHQGIAEHRSEMQRAYGSPPHRCHWCGEELHTWKLIHIDHLDDDGQNNHLNNLVFSCRNCNLLRGRVMIWAYKMPPRSFLVLRELLENYWLGKMAKIGFADEDDI